MSHSKSFIQLLRKISLILLLILTVIMLAHILLTIYICTSLSSLNTHSSLFDAILLVCLYYVIPLITLFCLYLLTNQLTKMEIAYLEQKAHRKTHQKKKLQKNN